MIALIRRDLKLYISRKNLLILLPIFMMITYSFLFMQENIDFNKFILIETGNDISGRINGIYLCLVLVINGYFIWQSIYFFTHDIYTNSEFIFLRFKKSSWLLYKYISVSILNIISNLLFMFVTICLLMVFNYNFVFFDILQLFALIIVIRLIYQFIVICLFSLFKAYGLIISLVAIMIPLFIENNGINIFKFAYASQYSSKVEIVILLMLFVIIVSLTFSINKKVICKLFEGEVRL